MKDSLYLNIDYVDSEIKRNNTFKVLCITVSVISLMAFVIDEFFLKTKLFSSTVQNLALLGVAFSGLALFLLASANRKISKDLINNLITKENNDERLTNTIREIYRLKGEIYISDLNRLRHAVNLGVQQYYDDKIKTGTCHKYTEEQASSMINTEKRLVELLEILQPKKPI